MIYSRTTSDKHREVAQDFFKTLYDNNKFTEDVTEQFYERRCARIFSGSDTFVVNCPKCGNPDAYGDQCEKCGSTLKSRRID